MMSLDFLAAWVTSARSRACGSGRERGDVPGWVMVTVMSAILVVAILAVFEPQIKDAIGNALDSVTSSK
jgi:predicted Co/Zn/Cd cation transporter (cation efflux family)